MSPVFRQGHRDLGISCLNGLETGRQTQFSMSKPLPHLLNYNQFHLSRLKHLRLGRILEITEWIHLLCTKYELLKNSDNRVENERAFRYY